MGKGNPRPAGSHREPCPSPDDPLEVVACCIAALGAVAAIAIAVLLLAKAG